MEATMIYFVLERLVMIIGSSKDVVKLALVEIGTLVPHP